jgi:hypothetical protein
MEPYRQRLAGRHHDWQRPAAIGMLANVVPVRPEALGGSMSDTAVYDDLETAIVTLRRQGSPYTALLTRLRAELKRLHATPQRIANRIIAGESHLRAAWASFGDYRFKEEEFAENVEPWLDNLVYRVADEIDNENGHPAIARIPYPSDQKPCES